MKELKYKVRLEKMDIKRLAKKTYNTMGKISKWMKNCERNVKKVGLKKTWIVKMNGSINEWRLDCQNEDTRKWSINKWNIEINKKTRQYGLNKWKEEMRNKTTLQNYGEMKETPRKELFYDGSYGSSLLFKARTNSLEVNRRTWRWLPDQSKIWRWSDANLRGHTIIT